MTPLGNAMRNFLAKKAKAFNVKVFFHYNIWPHQVEWPSSSVSVRTIEKPLTTRTLQLFFPDTIKIMH